MDAEDQNIEWKSIWKDEYLKWVCGFANAEGGTVLIGVDDKGKVIGLNKYQKLLKDLPNKIRDILGITADVNLRTQNNKHFIEIKVPSYSTPISYKGYFYYRSGSTVHDLKGPALEKFLLNKMGKKWDGVIAHGFSLEDLSHEAIELFRKKTRKSKRVPEEDINETDENLLTAMGLLSNNELKRAAVIAFGKEPEKLITGAYVKIGFFRTDTDLLYQDEIHGSLFTQVEKTMDLLLTKYMKANIAYEGLTRTETYDYPENALREALLNALIHKDYASATPIQISVYKDWLMIWNAGDLPKGWTIETLKHKHISEPANPDIANAFFRAGYIEIWGRGTLNIVEYCTRAGLPEPKFEDKWGGLAIIFKFKKTSAPEKVSEKLGERLGEKLGERLGEKLGEKLGENQLKIIKLIENNTSISIKNIAREIGISTTAVENNIKKLKGKEILKRIGSAKGGYWEIIDNKIYTQ